MTDLTERLEAWGDSDAEYGFSARAKDLHLAATTLETLTQENARLREAGWRDIESAPDNGSFVLVIGGRHIIASVEKADGGWWRMAQHDGLQSAPTHWMPLPPAPAKSDLEAK